MLPPGLRYLSVIPLGGPLKLGSINPGSQRAVVWLLSLAAVLLPAAGIAYLGAVSYRDERGAVADRIEDQLRVAQRLAARVEQRLGAAVEAAAATFSATAGHPDRAALAALIQRAP